jgi:signal transduction histidine kinase/ligand-binding sensor domain-containing protein
MQYSKLVVITIFFLLSLTCLWAQPNQYRFSRIDITQGLSNNQVKCFYKDKRGFIWIGTSSGLNRYDGYSMKVFTRDASDSTSVLNDDINAIFEGPEDKLWVSTWSTNDVYDPQTERFLHNSDQLLRSLSIPEGRIINILKDAKENYWFIHSQAGIFKYTGKETIGLVHNPSDTTSINSNSNAASLIDPLGNIWVIHTNGVIEKIDGTSHKVVYRSSVVSQISNSGEYNFMLDADGDLWVHAINGDFGVFHFDISKGTVKRITSTTSGLKLNASIVRSVIQDNKGLIWIATDHGGINVIDKRKGTVDLIVNDPEDNESLIQNSINTLFKDDEGIIWAGSFKKGICFYHQNIKRFNVLRHQKSNRNSLPFDDVNAFAEDEKGNLWIGTNGGGLIYYDRLNNTYKQYLHDPSDPKSLSNNVIVCLYMDKDQTLWIGTYFGGLNRFDGKHFVRYKNDPKDNSTLADDGVWEIYEDSNRRLWIGTLTKGVDFFDREKNKFIHYKEGAPNSIHANYITSFVEDREGNLWIGTGYGVDKLDRQSGRFIHYLSNGNKSTSLSNNSILSCLLDSQGRLWFGTHGGLNLYDKRTDTFKSFKKTDGLAHNTIVSIVEDKQKNLWLGTPNGLSHVIMNSNLDSDTLILAIRNYDESDGLQGKQFTENAAIVTRNGEVIFGGPNGINIVNPSEIQLNTNRPRVMLTDFQVFNKSIHVGELRNNSVILEKSITETESIILNHSDNVFSLEFTALSYFHPEKGVYKYKLEGFNQDWLVGDGSQHKVTYTNLDPGVYTFRVKASNNDGLWNEEGVALSITVLPPFWKSKYAFILYVLVTFAALLFSRKLILERERLKYRIEKSKKDAQHMHELDMMKLQFFTNVSHEFRTPLTLIITPLEKILRQTTDETQRSQFQLIYRNARRLLNLVNQLLDFRKIEVEDVKLNVSEGNIVGFIKETAQSFTDLSDKKNITFNVHASIEVIETTFDKDKLEKIVFNLLSNAFKFTHQNGNVSIKIQPLQVENQPGVQIEVVDDGIGIPPEKHEQIFERFFQFDIPRTMVNQGSGIGLSITREFVKAHGGVISVKSDINKGACFTVWFPTPILTTPLEKTTHVDIENMYDFLSVEDELNEEVNKKASLIN